MGGSCTKASSDASAAASPGRDDRASAAGRRSASSDGDGIPPSGVKSSMTTSPTPRRDSERRGLRQGLVQKKERSVWDVYESVKEVGHGMTGKVYQVINRSTRETYALKCMEMRRIDPELLDDLRNEIELLKLMDHPNVIKLYEYFEDESNMYLILELCDGGELFDRLHAQAGSRYSEAEAARLMFKMTAAIGYCHYMGVSHRDLKLENFIFESRDAGSNIKLIDFGLSAKYGSSIRRMHTMVGTPYYIAPEVLLQSEAAGTVGYTHACDCWSLGVIAYMLLSGTPPFKGKRDREVLAAVRRGKYTLSGPKWEAVSEEAKDFIRHLLVYNPAKRMTAEQALKHPWLRRARVEAESVPLDPEIIANLRDFAKFSAFKRTALEAIAFSMSAQSIAHLREEFTKMDRDQSGFVSLPEFLEVVQSNRMMSAEEAVSVFHGVDQDNTNSISYTEFLAASLSRRLWLTRERIRDAFVRLDVDGTGYITRENLKAILGDDWTAEKAEAMMAEADSKGDGRIDFEEFLAVMTTMSKDELAAVMPVSPAASTSTASAAGAPASAAAAAAARSPRLGPAASAAVPLRSSVRAPSPPTANGGKVYADHDRLLDSVAAAAPARRAMPAHEDESDHSIVAATQMSDSLLRMEGVAPDVVDTRMLNGHATTAATAAAPATTRVPVRSVRGDAAATRTGMIGMPGTDLRLPAVGTMAAAGGSGPASGSLDF